MPISAKLHHTLLKVWHAWVAGSFLVAYLTADEDTYAMHQFAGYAVLAAIAVRLLVGLFASASSPLRLPRPDLKAGLAWFAVRKGRHPLFAWFSAALLLSVGLGAVSGALADGAAWLEDPHEALAEASLWVIFAHIGFVAFIYGGKRLFSRAAAWLADLRPLPPSKENAR
jgi:cytochrome b